MKYWFQTFDPCGTKFAISAALYGEIGGFAGIGSFTAALHEYQWFVTGFVGAVHPDEGVVVVVVVVEAGAVSQCLTVPGSGSPKVALLQATPPPNTRGAVNVPFAP